MSQFLILMSVVRYILILSSLLLLGFTKWPLPLRDFDLISFSFSNLACMLHAQSSSPFPVLYTGTVHSQAAIKNLIGSLQLQIKSFLRNLKIYYVVYKYRLSDPIRSQIYAAHTLPIYTPRVSFN